MEQTKRKLQMAELPLEANSKENLSIDTSVEVQTLLPGEQLSKLHDYAQSCEGENMKLKEGIHWLEKENENLKEVNSKLKQEVISLKYALENYRFDIDKYNEKVDDIGSRSFCPMSCSPGVVLPRPRVDSPGV